MNEERKKKREWERERGRERERERERGIEYRHTTDRIWQLIDWDPKGVQTRS